MQVTGGATCPHCQQQNPLDASFCQHCGKAMPSRVATGPRVVEGEAFAVTDAGRTLQAEDLRSKTRKAAGALLAVAIIQTLFIGLVYLQASAEVAKNPQLHLQPRVFAVLGGISALFWGLWAWSRSNPLPAAIVALVVYLSLWFIDVLVDPSQIVRGIIVKVIVLAVLIRAIRAGVQHRQLVKDAPSPASPTP